jgi:hypothetical protein
MFDPCGLMAKFDAMSVPATVSTEVDDFPCIATYPRKPAVPAMVRSGGSRPKSGRQTDFDS